jgi:hypothetical protein
MGIRAVARAVPAAAAARREQKTSVARQSFRDTKANLLTRGRRARPRVTNRPKGLVKRVSRS